MPVTYVSQKYLFFFIHFLIFNGRKLRCCLMPTCFRKVISTLRKMFLQLSTLATAQC